MTLEERIDAMSQDEKAAILRTIMEDTPDNWLNSQLCKDEDGELFVILESWEELSTINERLGIHLASGVLEKWRPVYESIENPTGGPYADMQLGNSALPPYNRVPPYLVPNGLIDLDAICESGFSDEYTTCSDCNVLIRTSPDHYEWQARYDISPNGEIYCPDCIDADEYIDARVNRNILVNVNLVNPADHGFAKEPEEYESGLHPHMDDDPLEQIDKHNAGGFDVVFTGSPSQFYISYTVWIRKKGYSDRYYLDEEAPCN